MGTRATTWIYERWAGELPPGASEDVRGPHLLAKIYRQFDGYFDSHGKELAEFLAIRKVVNGIGDNEPCFNGGGCCAAQVIWFLKDKRSRSSLPGLPERPHPRPGSIYMQRFDEEREYYHYDVIVNVDDRAGSIELVAYYDGNERFRGTPAEFVECCHKLRCSDEDEHEDDDDDDDDDPGGRSEVDGEGGDAS